MPRFMRVLIYLPYGVIIRDYLVSYYTAQNIACNRSFCRRLNACKSGARDENVLSLNCDRRFHFFKATGHTIAFCTRESVLFFFQQPAKARQKRALNVNRCHRSAGRHKFKSAVLVSGVPYQKSTLKNLEHILPCKSSGPCIKLLARVPKFWSAMPRMNVV